MPLLALRPNPAPAIPPQFSLVRLDRLLLPLVQALSALFLLSGDVGVVGEAEERPKKRKKSSWKIFALRDDGGDDGVLLSLGRCLIV